MLIDLHTHTRAHSACSSLSPEHLLEAAKAAGLDGVCLTEHDRLWPADEARALSERYGLLVLRGMEVTTELGHVLVFGLEGAEPDMYFAARLRQYVEEAGGLMFLAHPFRDGAPAARERVVRLVDSLEALNGSDGPGQNRSALALAEGMRLPGIGGSDAHSLHEVGTAATRFEAAITSEAEFLAALRSGCYRPVDLSGRLGLA